MRNKKIKKFRIGLIGIILFIVIPHTLVAALTDEKRTRLEESFNSLDAYLSHTNTFLLKRSLKENFKNVI